jgi:signal transduction histidine kinase
MEFLVANKDPNVLVELKNQIKSEYKTYAMSFIICVSAFVLVSVSDILMSLHNKLPYEAIATGFINLCNIVCLGLIYFRKKNNLIVPILFFIGVASISILVLLKGFSNGSYFYFFPSVIIYIHNTSSHKEKMQVRSFFLNVFIFILALTLLFLFLTHATAGFTFSTLYIFRLLVGIILSALLIGDLTFVNPTFTKAVSTTGRKNYFEALFQSNLDAYIVFDKETKEIVDFNKRAALLFELPDEVSFNGLYISQLMMRYLNGSSVNLELLMDNIPDFWHGEGNFTTHNKYDFTGYVSSVTYVKEEKKYQILSIRDISDIKETEKELSTYKVDLENSTQVKTRFLSSMSHELRTPLNGIIGTSNLILSEPDLPEHIKSHLNLQLYSSEHMLSIINDILDFSKIDSGKMELNKQPFNLLEALQNLTKSFENQFKNNKIELIFKHDPELADVNITSDEVKLRQVLYNLLSNALKFTLEGNVTLSATIEKADNDQVSILFSVKDTGIGIKKEKQSEIFEGFSQVHADDLKRKFGGTGLGLTISEKLVNIFGGAITVESELGQGSNFYFTVPFNRQLNAVEKVVVSDINSSVIDIRGVRILIVEDNEINISILKGFLNKWGICIKEATNGILALELLKYHKFDIILMDLEMPEMNGYTAVKIIRETNTEVPIIAFTATLIENMESLITDNGFNDYVLKPFRPADLKKKIEKFAPYRSVDYA